MHARLMVVFAALCAALGATAACGDATPAAATSSSATTGGAGGAQDGPGGATMATSSSSGGSGGMPGSGGAGVVDTCAIGTLPAGGAGPGGGGAAGRVRVVAANLTSGNNQSYDGGHGVRILQGLDADVVLMQEMNFGNNTTPAIDTLVDDVCAGRCAYKRGPPAEIPNGVLSRLPIVACGSWIDPEVSNRNFVWARIDVPGAADLWAISVHLLSTNATARNAEAMSLLAHIGANIPASDMIVLGGDLNTNSRTEAAVVTLSALFDTAAPYPADQNGNGMTNAPRNAPYDWLLADAELTVLQMPANVGTSVFAAGAVIDTRVYMPLSDIAPALIDDSAAPSMQHMAVVKDFQIAP